MSQLETSTLSALWFRIGRLTRRLLGADRAFLVLGAGAAEQPWVIDEETVPEPGWLSPLPETITWLPREEAVLAATELKTHPTLASTLDQAQIATIAAAPLRLPQGVVGWLVAGFAGKPSGAALTAGVMGNLAESASLFLLGSLQAGQVQQRYRVLHEIGMQVQAEIDLDKVLSLVVQRAQELLRTDIAYITLLNEKTQRLEVTAPIGLKWDLRHAKVATDVGLVGTAYQQGRPVAVENYLQHPHSTTKEVRNMVLMEEMIAFLAAPMTREGRTIGVLVVSNRRPTRFRPDEVELLMALSSQASIAVENARLYRSQAEAHQRLHQLAAELADKVSQLERAMVFHRQLTTAALSVQGVREIARTLARLLNQPVCAVQGLEQPAIVYAHPTEQGQDSEMIMAAAREVARRLAAGQMPGAPPWRHSSTVPEQPDLVVVPVQVGGQTLGCLGVVQTSGALEVLEVQALEHAATVLALELSRQRAAIEAEIRLRGDLLDDIVLRRFDNEEEIVSRAVRLGVSLDRLRQVMVFQYTAAGASGGDTALSSDTRRLALRTIGSVLQPLTSLVAWRSGRAVALVEGESRSASARELAERIQERLQQDAPSLRCVVGIGDVVAAASELHRSYREAVACVEVARVMGADSAIVEYPQSVLLQLCMQLPDRLTALNLVRQSLGPLKAHDRRHESDLLETMRAYVEADGHLKHAAERLYMHVNGLKYRLGRIERVLGANVRNSETRFQYRIAFRVLDFLVAIGASPWDEPLTSTAP